MPDTVIVTKFWVIDFLPMLNFLADPLIYGIRMREIRRAYRRLLVAVLPCVRCCCRGRPDQAAVGMTDVGSGVSAIALTPSRTRTVTAARRRAAARNLLDTEISVHDDDE